jgi:hypothetical protein
MKKQKIVKITESELTRLINLIIIKEQSHSPEPDIKEPGIKPDIDTPTRKDPRKTPYNPPGIDPDDIPQPKNIKERSEKDKEKEREEWRYEKISGVASTHEKQLIDAEFSKVKEALSMMQSDLRDYYSEEHRAKFDPIRKTVIAMIEKYMAILPKKSPGWG